MADITARFRLDISGIDAALTRVAAATLAAQGAFAAANAALAPLQGAFSAIKDSLDLGGRLSDVSAQTGITVSDLVVLRQAFANAGLGADAVGPAINRLQRALGGINEDGEPTNAALERLGVSMRELQSLSPAEQFNEVSKALAAITDPTERNAIAMGIFGRSGAALMALFKDTSALQVAGQQVGGLAATMEASANKFDFISDAFGAANLKGQQLAAGITQAIAPALEEIALALNATDLTGLGQTLGALAASVLQLGQALSGMIPQIAGVVVALALFRSGFDAKVIAALNTAGPAALRAFAQINLAIRSVSFSSISVGARTAFAAVGVAARGAALAIKGALVSTGVGALVVALGMAIEAVIGRINAAQEAFRALKQTSTDTLKAVNSIAAAMKEVSSEGDKVALGERIQAEIDAARAAMENLEETASNLSQSDRNELSNEYRRRIQLLEQMRIAMEGIPPEVMAGRQAEKDRAAAIEDSRRKAEALTRELGNNREALNQKISDAATGDLSAEEQRSALLDSVGAGSTSDVDDQIAALFIKKESVGLTDEEVLQTQRLMEAREKLINIERAVANERERAAEEAIEAERKATEAAERRAQYERDAAREIARLRALAAGDTQQADRIEREQRIDQETMQGIAAGLTPQEARSIAENKVGASDSAATAQREAQNRETMAAVDLELRLAEAKAAGNRQEARRFEWLQKYHSELKRLREIMNEDEAMETATRMANAQDALSNSGADQQRGQAGALFASSLARIGAGGNFVGSGADPMLNESRRQTSLLERIARSVGRPNSGQIEVSYALA